jgi:transducin (beta)-like 1
MFGGSISIWSPMEKDKRPFTLTGGHSEQLSQVSFSPNGRFLASTDYERKLVIWSTKVKILSNINVVKHPDL